MGPGKFSTILAQVLLLFVYEVNGPKNVFPDFGFSMGNSNFENPLTNRETDAEMGFVDLRQTIFSVAESFEKNLGSFGCGCLFRGPSKK